VNPRHEEGRDGFGILVPLRARPMFQTVDAAQLKALLEGDERPRLIDVRTTAEFARGTIAGAQHVELSALPANLDALDPAVAVVLVCQSGGRSSQGCALLDQRGFKRVYNLGGGIAGWIRTGFPISN
jgi:rhodanese-related sulfurtransferase